MHIRIDLLLSQLPHTPGQIPLQRLDPLPELRLAITESLREKMGLDLGVELVRPKLHRLLQLDRLGVVLVCNKADFRVVELGARAT